jgi:ABC-type transport system substrate-binding protein
LIWNVLDPGDKLKPEFKRQGIVLARGVQPAISYTYFNMEDQVVGGYATAKIALRRAISMAYNTDEEIRVVRQGQGEPATQPVPPNVTGYNPKLNGHVKYDPAGAKALLDKFGYVDHDGDGWRDLPDGKPLTLTIASPPSAVDRQFDELWKKSMDAVGLRIEFVKQKWPDLLKMGRAGQPARVQPALRPGAAVAGLAATHAAVRADVGVGDSLRAVEARCLPLRDCAHLPVGARLQVQRLRPVPVEVSRPGRRAACPTRQVSIKPGSR